MRRARLAGHPSQAPAPAAGHEDQSSASGGQAPKRVMVFMEYCYIRKVVNAYTGHNVCVFYYTVKEKIAPVKNILLLAAALVFFGGV